MYASISRNKPKQGLPTMPRTMRGTHKGKVASRRHIVRSLRERHAQMYVPSTAARTKSLTRGGVLSATEIQANNKVKLKKMFFKPKK